VWSIAARYVIFLVMPHELRVALWLVLALAVYLGLARHVGSHARRAFTLPAWVGRAFAAMLVLGVLASVLPRFAPALLGVFSAPLGQLAGVCVIGLIVTSVLLVPLDLARGLARLVRRRSVVAASAEPSKEGEPGAAQPSRRALIQQVAVVGAASAGFGGSLYGTLLGRRDYALETVPVRLARLPRELDGLTLVQLSDLHFGQFLDEAQLARGLELVRAARPDAIVLTGDLIDHDVRYTPALFRFVRTLGGLARYGVFAVPGNHDHYVDVFAIETGLREAGAEVLTNRHVSLGDGPRPLVLAGLDDVAGASLSGAGRGPDLTRAFAGAGDERARVLLSHNPSYFPTAAAHADLTLSGHTHGGQISLFINPAELVLPHGFVRGLYARDGRLLYVNRGFGTAGPPIRVGSLPEVTRLVLTV
jgi:uncharacterized protein